MGTLAGSSKFLSMVMPKKVRSSIESLNKMKKEQPNLGEAIDKKIQAYEKRLKIFSDHQNVKNESLGKVQEVLDLLEQKLSNNQG